MNNFFINNLIYENENSLNSDLCIKLIKLYEENSEYHNEGRTISGVHKNIKDTTDMLIPKYFTNERNTVWEKIQETLQLELQKNLEIYIDNLSLPEMVSNNEGYDTLSTRCLHTDNFMIQKYNKLIGKYKYHNDFIADSAKNRHRILTYLWYLNTVEEGGHTEFFGNYLIQPKQGKLILFPSSWTFPHCGKVPISNDKYIITGWLYAESHTIIE